MLKKHFFLLFALVGGLVGAVARGKMVASYSGSAIPTPSTSSMLGIAAISVLVVAVLALLALSMRRELTQPLQETAVKKSVWIPGLLGILGGGLALFATFRFLTQAQTAATEAKFNAQLSGGQYRPDVIAYVFVGLLALAAFAMLLATFRRCSAVRSPMHDSLVLLLPPLASCIWLMISYRHFAGDPFVTDYIFALFAMLFGMLAQYFIAANSFQGDSRPYLCVTAGVAIYFSVVNVRFDIASPDGLLCLAQIFYFASILLLIARDDPAIQPIPEEKKPISVNAQKEELPE